LILLVNLLNRYSSRICPFLLELKERVIRKRVVSTAASKRRADLAALMLERDSYNPIDQLACYVICERKINKLKDEAKGEESARRTRHMSHLMYVKGAFMALLGLLAVAIMWSFRERPVIVFSSGFNDVQIFYPFDGFFAFPCATGCTNAIGVTMWMFIVNRFLEICLNKSAAMKGAVK